MTLLRMDETVNIVLHINLPEPANIPRMARDEAVIASRVAGVSLDNYALLI